MDKIKNYIIISLVFLIMAGLSTLFGYLYYKEKNKPPYTVISTITEVRIDTLQFTDSLFYPVPVEVIKPVFDTIIDTQYVFNDYYTGKIYKYEYKDTNLSITSGIMIHKNTLVSLVTDYEIYRKTTTITNTIEVVSPPKFALSVGGGIDYFGMIGLNLSASIYFDKNDIGIFYDPFLKGFGVTYKRVIFTNN